MCKNVHAFKCRGRQSCFFSLLENWAMAAYLKVNAHACAVSQYHVFIVCLELRGTVGQFPKHTTIEQQSFLSVCAISILKYDTVYIEHICPDTYLRFQGNPAFILKSGSKPWKH